MFLREGGMSSYGVCFQDKEAYVSGNKVDDTLYENIGQARLCADHTNSYMIKECAINLKDIATEVDPVERGMKQKMENGIIHL